MYAIARLGDDLADEQGRVTVVNPDSGLHVSGAKGLEVLDRIVDMQLPHGYHPVFMAIQDAVTKHTLPSAPFHRLFEAFRRDAAADAIVMQSWDDVFEYCTYSANPVGELFLRLSGNWSAKAEPLSNAICTALQITNFLQDLSVDLQRNRSYIPGMPINPTKGHPQAIAALDTARTITKSLFKAGQGVVFIPRSPSLRLELLAVTIGGRLMLRKCTNEVLQKRLTL